jgi:hypothetical protein
MNSTNFYSSGSKRVRDEAVAFEQGKRRKVTSQDPLHVSRINFMFNSLCGINHALSQGVQLHQEQKDRLVVFVNDIDQMQQEGYISPPNLHKLVLLLGVICSQDIETRQNIGQKVRYLSECI